MVPVEIIISRKFKVVNWTEYYKAKRKNPNIPIKKLQTTYTLQYKRIPGYDHLSQKQYAQMLTNKLEERRQKIVAEILASGKGFAGAENIKQMPPGSKPKSTKTSTRHSHRPRVHSVCPIRRAEGKNLYFTNISSYRYASNKYRNGELEVEFPPGMYKPSCRPPPDES